MSEVNRVPLPEPWLRATHCDVPEVVRAVWHALELANEEVDRWCSGLTDQQVNARPANLEPLAYQLRHMSRSLDRLFTYAEGAELSATQLAHLKSELTGDATRDELVMEWKDAFHNAIRRLTALQASDLETPRGVGKKQLPSTVGGLLIHIAEHTQRHVVQMISTSKVVQRSHVHDVLSRMSQRC